MFGSILFLLNKNHHEYLNNKFNKYNITVIQGIILINLSENSNLSQKDLEQLFSLSKASITKYMADLEEKNYLTRTRMDDNKRKYQISLTKKSLEIVEDMKEISKEWEEKVGLKDFKPEFLEDLKVLLKHSYEIMEENK